MMVLSHENSSNIYYIFHCLLGKMKNHVKINTSREMTNIRHSQNSCWIPKYIYLLFFLLGKKKWGRGSCPTLRSGHTASHNKGLIVVFANDLPIENRQQELNPRPFVNTVWSFQLSQLSLEKNINLINSYQSWLAADPQNNYSEIAAIAKSIHTSLKIEGKTKHGKEERGKNRA